MHTYRANVSIACPALETGYAGLECAAYIRMYHMYTVLLAEEVHCSDAPRPVHLLVTSV